jgi:hypothetical protein
MTMIINRQKRLSLSRVIADNEKKQREMLMKKVVSFSGGRTSAYLCYLMKEMYGDDVDFVFMDTGAEHIETYRFLRRVNQCFELNVTCLRGDFSLPIGKGVGYKVVDIDDIKPDLKPFSEMMEKYGTPYIGGMFCTDRMKLKPFKKYCDDKYGKGNYEAWLGIRADELSRVFGSGLYKALSNTLGLCDETILKIAQAGKDRDDFFVLGEQVDDDIFLSVQDRFGAGIRYMAEISDFDKQDVLDFWDGMPFDLYIDEWLGNCVFCPKKSNLKLAAAQRDEPEMYHEYLTALYGDSVRHDDKTGHWSQMYRGKKSLEQVIGMFDGSTGDEIKARIRGTKSTDTGSCSESCEVFVCEANKIDMF